MQVNLKVELMSSTPNPEKLIEKCARECYQSFDKEKEEVSVGLLNHCLSNRHHSLIEHASATFRISGVSRSLSHQLVRHRLLSPSQKSQRYCKQSGFDYIIPASIMNNNWAKIRFENAMRYIDDTYNELVKQGIKAEDARSVLPNACETSLVETGNFREWLHVIDMRVSKHAQEEIRDMAIEIWKQLIKIAPNIFGIKYFETAGQEVEYKNEIYVKIKE